MNHVTKIKIAVYTCNLFWLNFLLLMWSAYQKKGRQKSSDVHIYATHEMQQHISIPQALKVSDQCSSPDPTHCSLMWSAHLILRL